MGQSCDVGSRHAAQSVIDISGPLVTRRQLIAVGVDYRWIRRRVEDGVWQEPYPGVLWAGRSGLRGVERLRAALAFAGEDAALARRTALEMWQGSSSFSDPIEVSVPHGRAVRRADGVVVHQRLDHVLWQRHGLPIRCLPQTLVDLAGAMGVNDLRCHAAEAVGAKRMRRDALLHGTVVPRSSLRVVRLIDEELRAGAISGGECALYRLVLTARLPLPRLNVEFLTDDGRYLLDALWEGLRLAVEVDGRSVHTKQEAFESDLVRQNAIHVEGVLIYRFPVSMIFLHPERVAATLDKALRARAADLRMPWPDVRRQCRY